MPDFGQQRVKISVTNAKLTKISSISGEMLAQALKWFLQTRDYSGLLKV
jgi:hypothetical protein